MISRNEEAFHIKGDPAAPGSQGLCLDYDLTKGKIEVDIRWRDRISTADVYLMDDHVMVHLFCPMCQNCLSIEGRKKRIRFNRSERRIDIERIRCSYEGCDWSVVIKDNLARS